MIKIIILKEIKEKIASQKIIVSYIGIILLFSLNGMHSLKQYKSDFEQYQRIKSMYNSELQDVSRSLVDLTFYYHKIACPPSINNISAGGNSNSLPNGAMFNYFTTPFPGHIFLREEGQDIFQNIDWNYILIMFISFLALIFSYDTFSGEWETGTLKMVLSNNISRVSVFMGKILSYIFLLSIPVLIGILINILQITLSNEVVFNSSILLNIFIFIFISILFIAINLLIGGLFSVLFYSPSKSLNYCLIAWIIFVFIIPQLSVIVSRLQYRIPTISEHDKSVYSDADELINSDKNASIWYDNWIGKAPAKNLILRANTRNKVTDLIEKRNNEYIEKCRKQALLTFKISKISPFSTYKFLNEQLFNTGIYRLINFEDQVNNYRSVFKDFVKNTDAHDQESDHLIWREQEYTKFFMSNNQVNFNNIPKFSFSEDFLNSYIVKDIRNGIIILFVWFLTLFILVLIIFNKYQIK